MDVLSCAQNLKGYSNIEWVVSFEENSAPHHDMEVF